MTKDAAPSRAATGRAATRGAEPSIPERTRVLVAGGGPAGSMAAILLAREGVEVTVLERDRFPRYHIGESLLTSAIPLLEFVGLSDRVERHGFTKKYGGFFRVKHGYPAGHVDFSKFSKYDHSYQVVRSEFDQLLLDYAREVGAAVYEETSVTAVEREGDRPTKAKWKRADGSEGAIELDHFVDATGLSGLMATRYLGNRRHEDAFANVAIGGYFKGGKPYRDERGVEHPGDFSMEALTDGAGWTWAIPLHDGTHSVGIVLHREELARRRERLGSIEAVYEDALRASPDATSMLESATRTGELRVWRDYSYFAERFSGPGWFLAGDAAGFVDPLFSSGVHMAFLGALSSAAAICSVTRGELDEDAVSRFHDRCLTQAYTRFMITVAGFYRQLRNQQELVLPGVTPEGFQLAFDLIQPLVSGNLDLDSERMSGDVIERTMKYTTDMMMEVHEYETKNGAAKLMATKIMDDTIADPLSAVDGMYVRLEQGRLGLQTMGTMRSAVVGAQRGIIKRVLSLRG